MAQPRPQRRPALFISHCCQSNMCKVTYRIPKPEGPLQVTDEVYSVREPTSNSL